MIAKAGDRRGVGEARKSGRGEQRLAKKGALALLLAVGVVGIASTDARAQDQCRAADLTGDGIVATPDFLALASCWGSSIQAPLGQYVGYAPTTIYSTAESRLTRDLQCRQAMGADAHMCSTQEISALPDPSALPFGTLVVAATPPFLPIQSNLIEWVTGNPITPGHSILFEHRQQTIESFDWAANSSSLPSDFLGVACCVEPAAP